MATATLTPGQSIAKRTGFRSGAASTPLMKGDGIEVFQPGTLTASDLLHRIGGDFQVEKRELLYAGVEPGSLVPSGAYGVIEGGTDIMHGAPVSGDYVTYDFARGAERVDEIAANLGGAIEGGFLLRDGALAVFIVDAAQTLDLQGRDRSELKWLVSMGHGGEAAVSFGLRWFRLFCANQLPGLASNIAGYGGRKSDLILSERHTDPGTKRADNAPILAEAALKVAQNDATIAEILAGVPISDRQIVDFLDAEIKASTDRGYAAKQNKVDKVLSRFSTEASNFGSNAWTGYQAIQWWEETKGDVTKRDGTRFTRTLNRTVSGDHTPVASRFARFYLPETAAKAALN